MVDQPPFRRESVAAPVYISWGAVIAGAIAAAALTFVLITFGAAIGLAVASPSATWRDTGRAWTVVGALASSDRYCELCTRWISRRAATRDWGKHHGGGSEFRDGIHGILLWGLAIIIGVRWL